MDRPKRRNMVLDLRTMDDKLRLWVDAEDLDEDDRRALETVRDVISDLISRQVGDHDSSSPWSM
jgi:hypothetical protein